MLRLHLIFKYGIEWRYELSSKLSDYLNKYKVYKKNEFLTPPKVLQRGNITTTDIQKKSTNEKDCKELIRKWTTEKKVSLLTRKMRKTI